MTMEFPNPLWTGDVTLTVHDNSGGAARILDLNDKWTVTVTIDVQDPTNTLAGQFEAHVFAESYGPGAEALIGSKLVDITPGDKVYDVDIEVPANAPQLGGVVGPPAQASFYKLVAIVEHRNTAGNETVVAGFAEAPPIHLRNP
jgi:hypothetical protein